MIKRVTSTYWPFYSSYWHPHSLYSWTKNTSCWYAFNSIDRPDSKIFNIFSLNILKTVYPIFLYSTCLKKTVWEALSIERNPLTALNNAQTSYQSMHFAYWVNFISSYSSRWKYSKFETSCVFRNKYVRWRL